MRPLPALEAWVLGTTGPLGNPNSLSARLRLAPAFYTLLSIFVASCVVGYLISRDHLMVSLLVVCEYCGILPFFDTFLRFSEPLPCFFS